MTPNSGSVAGSVVYAKIEGAGVGNSNIMLKLEGQETSFCESQEMVSYGVLKCNTLPQTIEYGPKLQIKVGDWDYFC